MFGGQSKKQPDRGAKSPSRDVFSSFHGGKMTRRYFDHQLRRVPLHPHEREYVKAVMSKFDNDHSYHDRGITREEFRKGLDEMARNKSDVIDRREVERIKKYF